MSESEGKVITISVRESSLKELLDELAHLRERRAELFKRCNQYIIETRAQREVIAELRADVMRLADAATPHDPIEILRESYDPGFDESHADAFAESFVADDDNTLEAFTEDIRELPPSTNTSDPTAQLD